MNNTALRAGAQSANNTHMVFANEEHEKFYYEKLEQARYQDCYHKALIYILGMDGVDYGHLTEQEQKIVLLDGVGDVLFQALLLDDVEYGNHELSANLHTVYCLNEKW